MVDMVGIGWIKRDRYNHIFLNICKIIKKHKKLTKKLMNIPIIMEFILSFGELPKATAPIRCSVVIKDLAIKGS